MMKKKVLLGMSGGVDSSAAAVLLAENGYDVTGCTLSLCPENNEKNISDSKAVCEKLGIAHLVIDMTDDFRRFVMTPFAESYFHGETPNPCILCNKALKFGKMSEEAAKRGFDCIATGHYAKIKYGEASGKYLLLRAADGRKDQSYVLYNLTQDILAKTVFPLHSVTKEEARGIAASRGLINAGKKDSEDICFVPDGNYTGFIESFTGRTSPAGNFIDADGNILGRHDGIINYTVGQRRGLGVTFGRRVFVTGKNAADNTVTLGSHEDLMKKEIFIKDVNIISGEAIMSPVKVCAKTRYSAKAQSAVIYPEENGVHRVVFLESVRAAAAGQACVFYDDETVLGGGTIL